MAFYTSCKICGSQVQSYIESKKIFKCVSCELIFFQQKLDQKETEELYKNLYASSEDLSYHAHKQEAQLIASGIQPKIGYNKKTVLKKILGGNPLTIGEIGAGVGVVGKYLNDKGYQYTGIELDESVAKKAQGSGLNIEPGSFEKLTEYQNSFDALLAFEVIEHIDDLGLCLSLIYDSLRAKGSFGFTVPNFNKRKNYRENGDKLFQPNPPIHVNFFTQENISKMLAFFGFKIELLKTHPIPDLNFRSKQTYRNLLRCLFGKFEGSTIMCVAIKE